jgi:hypothetical protein
MLPFIAPLQDPPWEQVLYQLVSETRAATRLSCLLASPSDRVLTLAVNVYKKIPWGTPGFEIMDEPNIDVASILSRRLLTHDCPVFGPAIEGLSLFMGNTIGTLHDDVFLESGFFTSDAPHKVFQLANSPDLYTQYAVASLLSWIGCAIETDPDHAITCIDAGLADAFWVLLTSPHKTVRETAVDAILSFIKDARCCDAFFSTNIIEALAKQASSTQNLFFSRRATRAIAEIQKHAKHKQGTEIFYLNYYFFRCFVKALTWIDPGA